MSAEPGLPTFLIIGAAKAGTTSLYAYLQQHPQIFMSPWKEPSFFALEGVAGPFAGPEDEQGERRRTRDLTGYRKLFEGAGPAHRARGEASTLYLYCEQAPARIRAYVPDVKLIALLRNPVERGHSAYRYLVRDGREPLQTFEEAIAAEDERLAANWEPIWAYRRGGLYHAQLQRYYAQFDRRQIAVFLYEDFAADPERIVKEIFAFLGVDPSFAADTSLRYNVSGRARLAGLHRLLATPNALKDAVKPVLKPLLSTAAWQRLRASIMARNTLPDKSGVAEETQRELAEYYAADIARLEELLGRDLSVWRRPAA